MAAIHFTPVLAHFGHWYISFPVYMGPVVALAAYIKWSGRRDRKRRRARGLTADADDGRLPHGVAADGDD